MPAQEDPNWRFAGACFDGQSFLINGVDVWKPKWNRVAGEMAIVRDPNHGQIFHFEVYEIAAAGKRIIFATGEFSNGVWGFYVPDSSKPS